MLHHNLFSYPRLVLALAVVRVALYVFILFYEKAEYLTISNCVFSSVRVPLASASFLDRFISMFEESTRKLIFRFLFSLLR